MEQTCISVVEHLPSMHKAWIQFLTPQKTKQTNKNQIQNYAITKSVHFCFEGEMDRVPFNKYLLDDKHYSGLWEVEVLK
jgi:hypothetical protein